MPTLILRKITIKLKWKMTKLVIFTTMGPL